MKTIAFIPLRGDSKGIPLKNVRPFCNNPLAQWCIKAALESSLVDKIYIAYDESIIKSSLGWYTNKIEYVEVPKMDDHCMQERPMLEFAKTNDFDIIVLLQATTPYIKTKDINGGINLLWSEKYDSVISVCRQHKFLWEQNNNGAVPMNYNPKKRPRRQEWDGLLIENGAFFITSRQALLDSKCRISGRIGLYEMPNYTGYEIDDETDWIIAEEIFRRRILNG